MRKFTSAVAAFLVIGSSLGVSVAASAHSYTFSGPITVFKGLSLSCTATVVKTPDHDPVTGAHLNTGTVVVSIAPPTDPRCAALNITSNPMNYVQGAAGAGGWKDMTIYGFRAETITLGNCYGDVVVKKREVSPGVWEMDLTTVIPEEFAGGDCYVYGTIPQI